MINLRTRLLSTAAIVAASLGAFAQDQDSATIRNNALKYLAGKQQDNGSFGSGYNSDVAVVSFAGLALLNSDAKAGDMSWNEHLDKCKTFVMAAQNKDGLFSGRAHSTMYSHAFATVFLAEYLRTKGGKKPLKKCLSNAVKLIVDTQNDAGSWRYRPAKTPDGDLSVTSCQIVALATAKRAGIEVPDKAFKLAADYVKSCQNKDGGFRYMPQAGTKSNVPRSFAALASLLLMDLSKTEEAKATLAYVVENLPKFEKQDPAPYQFYTYFYLSRILSQVDDETQKMWSERLQDRLAKSQQRDRAWRDLQVGSVYGTSIALIVLTNLE